VGGGGWVNALDVLCAGQFGLAVVVVRPSLVDAFRAAMGDVSLSLFTLAFTQSDNCQLESSTCRRSDSTLRLE
jgi:hypothetical protein